MLKKIRRRYLNWKSERRADREYNVYARRWRLVHKIVSSLKALKGVPSKLKRNIWREKRNASRTIVDVTVRWIKMFLRVFTLKHLQKHRVLYGVFVLAIAVPATPYVVLKARAYKVQQEKLARKAEADGFVVEQEVNDFLWLPNGKLAIATDKACKAYDVSNKSYSDFFQRKTIGLASYGTTWAALYEYEETTAKETTEDFTLNGKYENGELTQQRRRKRKDYNTYATVVVGTQKPQALFTYPLDGVNAFGLGADDFYTVGHLRSRVVLQTRRSTTKLGVRCSNICFKGDKMLLASDNTVFLNRKEKLIRQYEHAHKVSAICFHPDAALVATGDTKGTIVVWDTRKNPSDNDAKVFETHLGMHVTDLSFYNDLLVVTAIQYGRGTTQVWCLGTKEILLDTKQPAIKAAISPDGTQLAILRPKADGQLEVRPAS